MLTSYLDGPYSKNYSKFVAIKNVFIWQKNSRFFHPIFCDEHYAATKANFSTTNKSDS
jgi:hypothetical protein